MFVHLLDDFKRLFNDVRIELGGFSIAPTSQRSKFCLECIFSEFLDVYLSSYVRVYMFVLIARARLGLGFLRRISLVLNSIQTIRNEVS